MLVTHTPSERYFLDSGGQPAIRIVRLQERATPTVGWLIHIINTS